MAHERINGTGVGGGFSFINKQGDIADFATYGILGQGSIMLVGADGSRFVKEDGIDRHGHKYYTGYWENTKYSQHNYFLFDQAKADTLLPLNLIPEDQLIKADTLSALAEVFGMDA